MIKYLSTAALGLALSTGMAMAGGWTLSAADSRLAFGSIKKDIVGEVHSFSGLSGKVADDGKATIDIDLTSVETNIDIRNERMTEHVFKNVATATINAEFDMAELDGLEVGETRVIYVEGTLSLLGAEVWMDMDMFVARLSEDRVIATTNDMLFLATEDAGIDAGVTKLMELAELPGITRTAPVTLRLVFDADEKTSG